MIVGVLFGIVGSEEKRKLNVTATELRNRDNY
jgi:hypothetical protein